MRIRKLEIKGFGKLSGFEASLDDGVNLIYGVNESGKSTLQQFLMSMLYGLKGGRGGKDGLPAPIKRYRPWKGGEYGGSLEYILDRGEAFRVERDFNSNSVKIYDSLYNDITAAFNTGRDRSPLFAEQHLGLDETCFERTVLVRQMETRLGEGLEELGSRLANIVETGFEDVSFNKARDALKEALKNQVGTGRTSGKPLDRTTARLKELYGLRKELLERRRELQDMEQRLKAVENGVEALKVRQTSFGILEDIWKCSEDLRLRRKVLESLKSLQKTAEGIQQEMDYQDKHLQELAVLEEDYKRFSGLGDEDIDSIDQAYAGYTRLQERIRELEKQLSAARRDMEIIGLKIGRAAEADSDEAETRLVELDRETGILDRELQGFDIGKLKEECAKAHSRSRRNLICAIATAVAAFAAVAGGAYLMPAVFAAAAVLLIAALIFGTGFAKWSGEYTRLNGKRRDAIARSNAIRSDIAEKQREISRILQSFGVEDMKSFFRIKAEQDNLGSRLEEVKDRIASLEEELSLSGRSMAQARASLLEKLYAAGITESAERTVKAEYIKYYKDGINNNRKVRQEIEYTRKRLEELKAGMESCLKNVKTVCGSECKDLEELDFLAGTIASEIPQAEARLEELEKEAREACLAISDESRQDSFINLDQLLQGDEQADARLWQVKSELREKLEAARLEKKELETLIRDRDKDSDTLLQVEAEIESLEQAKCRLEELEFSLKTALEQLTCASEEIRRDYAPALNAAMSSIMAEITSGRYTDIKADSNLYLKLPAPETGDVVPVLSLSGGTADQAYLSMRIALADMLSEGGETLPLILDEVFAQYDDQRTVETLRFIKKMCRKRQILLFTCKSREKELVHQVLGCDVKLIALQD